jgi:DNA polymerase
MGIGEDQAYFASVLPRHVPMPDWKGLGEAGLAEILALHLQLAAPKRLISFGSNIPPLLGHDPTQSAQNLPILNHEGERVATLSERSLDALSRAKAKAGFWRRWLEWTGAKSA